MYRSQRQYLKQSSESFKENHSLLFVSTYFFSTNMEHECTKKNAHLNLPQTQGQVLKRDASFNNTTKNLDHMACSTIPK